MKYRIGEKCIQCFACIRERICPEQAIVECKGVYSIDQDKCTDCGTCYAVQKYFCPVRAFVDSERVARRQVASMAEVSGAAFTDLKSRQRLRARQRRRTR